jgi:hypothetical protein
MLMMMSAKHCYDWESSKQLQRKIKSKCWIEQAELLPTTVTCECFDSFDDVVSLNDSLTTTERIQVSNVKLVDDEYLLYFVMDVNN